MNKLIYKIIVCKLFLLSFLSISFGESLSKSYEKSTSTHTVECSEDYDSISLTVNGVSSSTTCNTGGGIGTGTTVTNSIEYGCDTYIESWQTTWSICETQGDWIPTGSIRCKQTPSFTPNNKSCGQRNCTDTCSGGNCSRSCGSCSGCPADVPKPTTPPVIKTINSDLNVGKSTCNNIYANNKTTCNISFDIWAFTEQNKGISWNNNNNIVSDINDISGELSNRTSIGDTSGKALNFNDISYNNIPTNTTNSFTLDIVEGVKSRSPFKSDDGKINFKLGGVVMELKNIPYKFLVNFEKLNAHTFKYN